MEKGFIVKQVHGKGDSIIACLGITEQRRDELCDLIYAQIQTSKTFTEAVAKISETVANANELAWCCVKIGEIGQQQRTKRERFVDDVLRRILS